MNEPLLTAIELADRWGVSRAHIYNLMAVGLPSVKVGRSRRFRPEVVDSWLSASQTGPATTMLTVMVPVPNTLRDSYGADALLDHLAATLAAEVERLDGAS